MSGKRLGKYELKHRLKESGMVEVYLAKQIEPANQEKSVIVKRIIPPSSNNRDVTNLFLSEGRLASKLRHPHIAEIYDIGESDGNYFVAMEYLNGHDLAELVDKAKIKGLRFPPQVTLHIIISVARALHYAHTLRNSSGENLGLIHRDVSPHNIILTYDGKVKLLDFGMARPLYVAAQSDNKVLEGKFGYLSPEQCKGSVVDARGDIFAAGVVLYELITNHRLFDRPDELSTMKAIIDEPLAAPSKHVPNIPPALEKIIMHALAHNPQERYENAGQLADDLTKICSQRGWKDGDKNLAIFVRQLFPAEEKSGAAEETFLSLLMKAPPPSPSGEFAIPPTGKPHVEMMPASGETAIVASYQPPAMAADGLVPLVSHTAPPPKATDDELDNDATIPYQTLFTSAPPLTRELLGEKEQKTSSTPVPPTTNFLRAQRKWLILAGCALATIMIIAIVLKLQPKGTPALNVSSEPSGATIFINSEKQFARTPHRILNAPLSKEFSLSVVLEGYTSWSKKFTLAPGDADQEVNVKLMRLGAGGRTASIRVNVVEPQAEVFLDGEAQGIAPLKIEKITAGEPHRILIRKDGYIEQLLSIPPLEDGEYRTLTVDLDEVVVNKKTLHGKGAHREKAKAPIVAPNQKAKPEPAQKEKVHVPRAAPSLPSLGNSSIGERFPTGK